MLKKRLRWFIARGLHLFPFRTEKLNLVAPMVLRKRESRSPPPSEESLTDTIRGAFSFLGEMGIMGGLGRLGDPEDREAKVIEQFSEIILNQRN